MCSHDRIQVAEIYYVTRTRCRLRLIDQVNLIDRDINKLISSQPCLHVPYMYRAYMPYGEYLRENYRYVK